MPENEILAEIGSTRGAIARENDCDVAKLFAHFREVTASWSRKAGESPRREPGFPKRAGGSRRLLRPS